MRNCFVTTMGLVAVFSAQSALGDGSLREDITWHSSYTKARELAISSGKPLLVEFR